MGVKTFAVSEVLTASDTNTYLANSGLVYVKQQTITSGSSLNVTSAFSSTYDRYRITIDGIVASGGGDVRFQLGSTTANYYGVYNYQAPAGTTAVFYTNNGSTAYIGGHDAYADQTISMDIANPNKAIRTTFTGQAFGNNYYFNFGYQLADTTQYTDFTIYTGGPTWSSGTITVYGYRKQ